MSTSTAVDSKGRLTGFTVAWKNVSHFDTPEEAHWYITNNVDVKSRFDLCHDLLCLQVLPSLEQREDVALRILDTLLEKEVRDYRSEEQVLKTMPQRLRDVQRDRGKESKKRIADQ
ncbi:hypothetical protein MBLNU457_7836t3 [Dothideomycetes sp. NU457]